jgi:hypothetical protein
VTRRGSRIKTGIASLALLAGFAIVPSRDPAVVPDRRVFAVVMIEVRPDEEVDKPFGGDAQKRSPETQRPRVAMDSPETKPAC